MQTPTVCNSYQVTGFSASSMGAAVTGGGRLYARASIDFQVLIFFTVLNRNRTTRSEKLEVS